MYPEDDEPSISFVNDIKKNYKIDLKDRLFKFALSVMKMVAIISNKKEYDVFRYQLSKSATSIGANYEEAQSSSLKEFVQKIRIALRESHETGYWLRLIKELNLVGETTINPLIQEIKEIEAMLGSIVSKLDKKIKEEARSKTKETRQKTKNKE